MQRPSRRNRPSVVAARAAAVLAGAAAAGTAYAGAWERNAFALRRYTLPLPRSPGILVTWARAIVRYKLHPDRITGEGTDPVVRDQWGSE